MSDPQVVNTLRSKRDAIERAIGAYAAKIETARRDLAHVNATLALFECEGDLREFPAHMSIARLFKRGEVFGICQKALSNAPDGLDTRELALAVIRAKGMDDNDAVLRKAIAYSVVTILRMRERRGQVADGGRRRNVRVWRDRPNS